MYLVFLCIKTHSNSLFPVSISFLRLSEMFTGISFSFTLQGLQQITIILFINTVINGHAMPLLSISKARTTCRSVLNTQRIPGVHQEAGTRESPPRWSRF